MNILIATPASPRSVRGNRITANRYADIVKGTGRRVDVVDSRKRKINLTGYDVLIALHGARSASIIRMFRQRNQDTPIVLVLTGTDLRNGLNRGGDATERRKVIRSMELADRIVTLQPESLKRIPAKARTKSTSIMQSCSPAKSKTKRNKKAFDVLVCGHLRQVKDPFRAALAARELPINSRIIVNHLGRPLTQGQSRRAKALSTKEERYNFVGKVAHRRAIEQMKRSRLLINSSFVEGGPMVVTEALVNDVPVLVSRIDSHIGLLGRGYPGLFNPGSTLELRDLMWRAESDPEFYKRLRSACRKLKPGFHPRIEKQLWQALFRELKVGRHA